MRKIIAFLLFICLYSFISAQTNQVKFGKNRIQYHDGFEEWTLYESDNFITYWYGKSRNVGRMAAQMAELELKSIQNILEHQINNKVEVIVYADLTDLKQSNIGSEQVFTNEIGETKVIGHKIFVYFDGNHQHLHRNIREGIATVYLESMLFGSTLQEVVQNAIALNLPEWFKRGLVAYVAKPWDAVMDDHLRDVILSDDFDGFEDFAIDNPRLAGQSLWYYIDANYGQSTLSNLLYLTRINRSEEEGFRAVLGSPFPFVLKKWEDYFKARYESDQKGRSVFSQKEIIIKNKYNLPITQVKLNPNGQQLAYATNEVGKYKVYVYDLQTGKKELILKEGFKNTFQATDYAYPLLAWNPNAQELSVVYEKRDVVKYLNYNVLTQKKVVEDMSPLYHRVYSMDFINPYKMVLSASADGYSDLFIYHVRNRQSERITRDFYDDLDPVFTNINNENGILFVSNRPDSLLPYVRHDTILPIENFDVYYYNLDKKTAELVRVTNTPNLNERQPMGIDSTWFAYLTEESGILNRKTAFLEEYIHHYDQFITFNDGSEITLNADSVLIAIDSTTIDSIIIFPIVKQRAVAHINSNYGTNILQQDFSKQANILLEKVLMNGKERLFIKNFKPTDQYELQITAHQKAAMQAPYGFVEKITNQNTQNTTLEIVKEAPAENKIDAEKTAPKEDAIDIDNYLFQSEFDDEEAPIAIENKDKQIPGAGTVVYTEGLPADNVKTKKVEEVRVHRIRPGKVKPYQAQFRTDYVTTDLDNSLLFEGLESFGANPDGFNYPPMGLLLKANLKDVFEDYQFDLGVRVPTSFNGTEYFVVFNDRKKRFDKQYAFYRKNVRLADNSLNPLNLPAAKREYNILLGQFRLRYPFDIFRSLQGTVTLRKDRSLFLASEFKTLEQKIFNEQRIAFKLEYIFDNTLDVQLNIKNGTRYKMYTEIIKRFNVDTDSGVKIGLNDGFMTVLGMDFRHYQRIAKYSILAFRAAAATSFGSEKILYILGGTDSELFNSTNNNIPIPTGNSFVYQTPATNIRGFSHNIRNGSSYVLANLELRVPILRYFSKKIRSTFLRNLQVIAFTDVGTAWSGSSPYDDENPLNISYFYSDVSNNPAVTARVKYYRDPIVASYGFGLRSTIFGHFFRFDYAWGVETRTTLKPRYHLSMGTDF